MTTILTMLKSTLDANLADTNKDGKLTKDEMIPFYVWVTRNTGRQNECVVSFVKEQ